MILNVDGLFYCTNCFFFCHSNNLIVCHIKNRTEHFLMILPQCATEAAAEREHHLMNNSKSGRQDIYSSVASERRDKKNPKCKTTKEAEKERERLKGR